MWVCCSLCTAGAVPLLELWVSPMWLCISLPIVSQEQMYVHKCRKKYHTAVSGGVWPWGRCYRCLLCAVLFGVRTPCLPGEQPVLWLRLGWFVVLWGWHNGILSSSLPSWKCIFVLSLCSFSIQNKNHPKQNSCLHLCLQKTSPFSWISLAQALGHPAGSGCGSGCVTWAKTALEMPLDVLVSLTVSI